MPMGDCDDNNDNNDNIDINDNNDNHDCGEVTLSCWQLPFLEQFQ